MASHPPPESTTLITREHHDKLNAWSEPRLSHPIDRSDIRKWAIAVYWPEKPPPLYWDEEYAKTTRWGGIIAPREFNPFAWPVEQPTKYGGARRDANGKGQRSMNGGQTETYGVPMRPGDVIASRIALVKFEERQTSLGLMLFLHSEMKWTNQRDEFVRSRISVGLRY